MKNFECFHGTSVTSANSIIDQKSIKSSKGNDKWFGDGVYAFIDGLRDPKEAALIWAGLEALDKVMHRLKYPFSAVIKFEVASEDGKTMDLNTKGDVSLLEKIQTMAISKLSLIGKRPNFIQGELINFARKELEYTIDVVVGNVYTQLSKESRVRNIVLHTPNCSMICVYKTELISNIELLEKRRIEK